MLRMTDGDRERGMLAPVDREWLRGEKDYDHRQQHYDRQKTIQQRIQDALIDFQIVYEYLPENQRKKIFERSLDTDEFEEFLRGEMTEKQKQPDVENQRGELGRGCVSFLALLYEQRGEEGFVELLERAIAHVVAGKRRPGTTDAGTEGIEVELNITHTDTVTPLLMLQKIHKEGIDRLSRGEQRALLHLLHVTGSAVPETADEFSELYQEYVTKHHSGEPVAIDRAVITLDPFEVTEGRSSPFPRIEADEE